MFKKNFSITTTSKKLNIDVSNEHIDAIKNLDVNRMKELICNKFDEKVPSNADISRVRGMGGEKVRTIIKIIYILLIVVTFTLHPSKLVIERI